MRFIQNCYFYYVLDEIQFKKNSRSKHVKIYNLKVSIFK